MLLSDFVSQSGKDDDFVNLSCILWMFCYGGNKVTNGLSEKTDFC